MIVTFLGLKPRQDFHCSDIIVNFSNLNLVSYKTIIDPTLHPKNTTKLIGPNSKQIHYQRNSL